MGNLIAAELRRMEEILRHSGFKLEMEPPVPPEAIQEAEVTTGIKLDEGMRALYSLANGSRLRTCLAVQTDELTPCCFRSIQDAVTWWHEWLPYDDRIHRQFWGTGDERGEKGRDSRIQPDFFVHNRWFPFAESNYWSTAVYFDADPAPRGTYGQIIAYQHDPEAVYFLANNVLEFLRQSNDRLAAHANELLFVDGRPTF